MFSRDELMNKLPPSTWTKVESKLTAIEDDRKADKLDTTLRRAVQYVEDEAALHTAVTALYVQLAAEAASE